MTVYAVLDKDSGYKEKTHKRDSYARAYDHVDEETLKRLREIQKLSPENKSHVYALLDAFIKQTKLQAIL